MKRIKNFYNSIVQAQCGDQKVTIELVEQFYPMFDSYAKKLYYYNQLEYEDSFSALQCYFIEMIKTVDFSKIESHTDASLVTYFSHGIYYYYIKLSKRSHQNSKVSLDYEFSGKNGENVIMEEVLAPSTEDKYDFELLDLLNSILTTKESLVIKELYFDGFTQNDVSKHLKCTPSAVSQLKHSAFKKLKKYYSGEERKY